MNRNHLDMRLYVECAIFLLLALLLVAFVVWVAVAINA
jgi:hypothetical protein